MIEIKNCLRIAPRDFQVQIEVDRDDWSFVISCLKQGCVRKPQPVERLNFRSNATRNNNLFTFVDHDSEPVKQRRTHRFRAVTEKIGSFSESVWSDEHLRNAIKNVHQ